MVDDPILVMGAQLLQAGVLDPPPSEHVRNVERMRELGITHLSPFPTSLARLRRATTIPLFPPCSSVTGYSVVPYRTVTDSGLSFE